MKIPPTKCQSFASRKACAKYYILSNLFQPHFEKWVFLVSLPVRHRNVVTSGLTPQHEVYRDGKSCHIHRKFSISIPRVQEAHNFLEKNVTEAPYWVAVLSFLEYQLLANKRNPTTNFSDASEQCFGAGITQLSAFSAKTLSATPGLYLYRQRPL